MKHIYEIRSLCRLCQMESDVCVFVCVYLQIGRERVRKPHVAWEGTEDEVAKLDAVGWDNITEAIMVITQELWEVMQQDQQHSQRALKQPMIV